MAIPVGNDWNQWFKQVDKLENGTVTIKDLFPVMYVPLTDADRQWTIGRCALS